MLEEVSPTRRMRLYRMWVEQRGLCGICEHPIDEDEITYPALVNVDHIIPRALNGGDGVNNLQLAHAPCNTVKGSRVGFRLERPAQRKSIPRQRSKDPQTGDVRFVASGLDQGARVVYEPRSDDDEQPWTAETRYGAHVAINGKRFRSADVVTAEQFDRQWRKERS